MGEVMHIFMVPIDWRHSLLSSCNGLLRGRGGLFIFENKKDVKVDLPEWVMM